MTRDLGARSSGEGLHETTETPKKHVITASRSLSTDPTQGYIFELRMLFHVLP